MKKSSTSTKSNYHHGDLRSSIITCATQMIHESGVENLSLRKLAERAGVTRTAPYHHFKDKNDLLCAVAAQGFIQWQHIEEEVFNNESVSLKDRYRQFFHQYIQFAANNPALYDLMFGRTIWKNAQSNSTLRDAAYPSFQYQVAMTKKWQEKGLMPENENTLRLAQVSWGTMHGIARLLIDGIYVDASSIEEMCDCAVNLFLSQSSIETK